MYTARGEAARAAESRTRRGGVRGTTQAAEAPAAARPHVGVIIGDGAIVDGQTA